MPNTEHALVLISAQTVKNKRDGEYYQSLRLVIQEDYCMFLSILE